MPNNTIEVFLTEVLSYIYKNGIHEENMSLPYGSRNKRNKSTSIMKKSFISENMEQNGQKKIRVVITNSFLSKNI